MCYLNEEESKNPNNKALYVLDIEETVTIGRDPK